MESPTWLQQGMGDAAAIAANVGQVSQGFDVQQELNDLNFSLLAVKQASATAPVQLAVALPRRARTVGGEQPPGRQNELLYFKVGTPGSIYQGAWKKAESLRTKHYVVRQGFLTPGAGLRIALSAGGDAVVQSVETDGSSMEFLMSSGNQSGQSIVVEGGVPVFLAGISSAFLQSLSDSAPSPSYAMGGSGEGRSDAIPPPPP